MANGQQIAEQNFQTFLAWLAGKRDEDFRQMASRGVLSRTEIAKECGFSKSALDQNPRIKAALMATEDALRERDVLPALKTEPNTHGTFPILEAGNKKERLNLDRLNRLEQENASLRAENGELKRHLEQFVILRDALSATGRLPR